MPPTVPLVRHLTDEEFRTEIVPLWPEQSPETARALDGDYASLAVFLPQHSTGAAVMVCPGGGYGFLANDHEGKQVAEWFNALGVAAFVLRYRHLPFHRHPVPLRDAQQALRIIRARAEQWAVDPTRVGVLGFSAGGHLTATLGTHFDAGNPASGNPIARQGCRPDFLVLCYPVITAYPPYTHGCVRALLGDADDPALIDDLSVERRVTPDTPPTFLFHTDNDGSVHPMNSVLFYQALKEANVPAELHIYADGPHGVGLCTDDPVVGSWPARLTDWLRGRGIT